MEIIEDDDSLLWPLCFEGFHGGSVVKNLPAMQET